MAKRKDLKKAINNICGNLFADCVTLSMCAQANKDKLVELMGRVMELNTEFIARTNHAEKGNERKFYKKLRDDFTEAANALAEEIAKA